MKNVFHETFFVLRDGKLVFENKGKESMYNMFVKSLDGEGKYRVFIEEVTENHTRGQINKLHKCIRIIAEDTGNAFDDIKDEVKKRMGYKDESFGKASYEDLDLAIKETIRLGEELNINLY